MHNSALIHDVGMVLFSAEAVHLRPTALFAIQMHRGEVQAQGSSVPP